MIALRGPEMNTFPQVGIVTSVDLGTYRVRVHLPLMNHETDWLRVSSHYVGAGWGLRAPLHVGNEVLVVFENGDLNSGIVTGAMWSEDCDPTPNQGDSFCLVHESGSMMRFDSGGITIKAKNIAIIKG